MKHKNMIRLTKKQNCVNRLALFALSAFVQAQTNIVYKYEDYY